MTDGIRPVGPVEGRDRRAAQRREAERRAGSTSRELVPVGPVLDATPDPASPAASPTLDAGPIDAAAAFAAQVMGQSGQRRGLKGGPPVLDAARATYLGAEYSGEKERRPSAGTIRKTDL